jgi:hypothetical protein
MSKKCPEGKIMNPATGRCVNAEGKIGQKLLEQKTKPTKPASVKQSDNVQKYVRVLVIDVAYDDDNEFVAPFQTIQLLKADDVVLKYLPKKKVLQAHNRDVSNSDKDQVKINMAYKSIVSYLDKALINIQKVPADTPIVFVDSLYEIDLSNGYGNPEALYKYKSVASVKEVVAKDADKILAQYGKYMKM